jgi:hypothetical protein
LIAKNPTQNPSPYAPPEPTSSRQNLFKNFRQGQTSIDLLDACPAANPL